MIAPGNASQAFARNPGLLDRSRADHRVGETRVHIGLNRIEIAESASEVNLHHAAEVTDDVGNHAVIHRAAAAGTVKIHHVETARTELCPVPGHVPGVFGVDRNVLIEIPLDQTHAGAVLDVNGRDEIKHLVNLLESVLINEIECRNQGFQWIKFA